MAIWRWVSWGMALLLMAGCSNMPNRKVANSDSDQAIQKDVRSIKFLAQSGISLSIGSSIFHETESVEVGACKKQNPISWSNRIYQVAQLLEQNPQYANRFHFIRIEKSGGEPTVEVQGDDTSKALVIKFSKKRKMQTVDVGDEVPCPEILGQLMGQTMSSVRAEWPTDKQIVQALASTGERAEVEMTGQEISVWLAEQKVLINWLGPDNETLTKAPVNRWAALLSKSRTANGRDYKNLSALFQKIHSRSEQGQEIAMLVAKPVAEADAGILVSGSSPFSADINQRFEFTAPYLQIEKSSLNDLEKCLQKLKKENPSLKGFSDKKNNYLYPGHECR